MQGYNAFQETAACWIAFPQGYNRLTKRQLTSKLRIKLRFFAI